MAGGWEGGGVIPLQNVDLTHKTNLDFWGYFGGENPNHTVDLHKPDVDIWG